MADTSIQALHKVHTATNDVLARYVTVIDRAQPRMVPVIADLAALHRVHAAALQAHLHTLGHDGQNDTLLRGKVHTVAVTVRDSAAGLEEGTLTSVERGERALQGVYDDAISYLCVAQDRGTTALLEAQYREIGKKIDRLAAM